MLNFDYITKKTQLNFESLENLNLSEIELYQFLKLKLEDDSLHFDSKLFY